MLAVAAQAGPKIKSYGYGWSEYYPDRVAVIASFEAVALTPAEALVKLANSSDPFVEGLKAMGLNASLSSFGISAQYSYERGQKVFKGYKAWLSLKVELDDFKLAGGVVGLAAKCGAKDVDVYTYASKALLERAYLRALEMAARDAKLRGEAVAKGLGLTLGQPLEVEVGGPYLRPYEMRALGKEAPKAPTIQLPGPSKERIEAWVTVTFATTP